MKLPSFLTYVRGIDKQGSGVYGASRDGGTRTHKGIDIAYQVTALSAGEVTRIGYPYSPLNPKKKHFRYVQIQDEAGFRVRYFYVDPTVAIWDKIEVGDAIGYPQDLTVVYPGITPHIHFEVIDCQGTRIDPRLYIEGL